MILSCSQWRENLSESGDWVLFWIVVLITKDLDGTFNDFAWNKNLDGLKN